LLQSSAAGRSGCKKNQWWVGGCEKIKKRKRNQKWFKITGTGGEEDKIWGGVESILAASQGIGHDGRREEFYTIPQLEIRLKRRNNLMRSPTGEQCTHKDYQGGSREGVWHRGGGIKGETLKREPGAHWNINSRLVKPIRKRRR